MNIEEIKINDLLEVILKRVTPIAKSRGIQITYESYRDAVSYTHLLPIPAFIHFDDIEYGVRHSDKGVILINGICVWHPQAPNLSLIHIYSGCSG